RVACGRAARGGRRERGGQRGQLGPLVLRGRGAQLERARGEVTVAPLERPDRADPPAGQVREAGGVLQVLREEGADRFELRRLEKAFPDVAGLVERLNVRRGRQLTLADGELEHAPERRELRSEEHTSNSSP